MTFKSHQFSSFKCLEKRENVIKSGVKIAMYGVKIAIYFPKNCPAAASSVFQRLFVIRLKCIIVAHLACRLQNIFFNTKKFYRLVPKLPSKILVKRLFVCHKFVKSTFETINMIVRRLFGLLRTGLYPLTAFSRLLMALIKGRLKTKSRGYLKFGKSN